MPNAAALCRWHFAERRQKIDLLYSNSSLDGATLSAAYKNPFSITAEGV